MAQYCIINGMAVSINNQFNGYSLMATNDQIYQQHHHQQQQSNIEYYHHPSTMLQQPLPAAPPPPHVNGDAYCYTTYDNSSNNVGNNIPMPFQLKTEPAEEIIDDEDENLLQPIITNDLTTTLEQQQQGQLQQQHIPMNNDQFNQITADLKMKLSNSGFTQLPKDDPILKPFKCPICNKAFGRLSHVRRHQLLHTGEKPFECDVCHEKFTRIENRNRHMSIHTGERRHNCHICGKGFSQLNRLNVHIRIHSGERPFVCEICGKAFGRIDHKTSHMRTHNWVRDKNGIDLKSTVNVKMESSKFMHAGDDSGAIDEIQIKQEPGTSSSSSLKIELPTTSQLQGIMSTLSGVSANDAQLLEKPFKCPTCDKQFSRKDHLNRHIFIHSGTKPFQCEICSKLFSRKDNKYKHMASCMYMHFGIIIMKKPPSGSMVFNSEESKSLETKINEKLLEIQNGTLVPIPRGLQQQRLSKSSQRFGDHKSMLYEQIVQYQNEQMSESNDHYGSYNDDESAASATDSGTMIGSKDGAVEIMMVNPDIQPPTNSDDDYDDPEDDELGDDDDDDPEDDDDISGEIVAPECELTVIDQEQIHDNNHKKIKLDNSLKYENDFDHGVDSEQQMMENWRRQFECKVCHKWFVYKSHLVRHMLVHTGEKAFPCDQCDKRFYRKEHLQRHVIVHTGIKPYKCDFCDKTFIEQRAQLRHTMQHHVNVGVEQSQNYPIKNEQQKLPNFSAIQPPQSSSSTSLMAMGNKWDMVKPVIEMKLSPDGQQMQPIAVFKCDQCDRAYRRKSHLKQHYTTHTGEKPFKCDLCGQGFSRLEHKKRHMAIHMNIKRYECEFCDRKFSRPDHMLEHLKRHEGVLPYKCNRCGIRFATSKEKMDHLRTHVDAYRCDCCPERFETHHDLTVHRQTVHGLNGMKKENVGGGSVKHEILVNKMQEFPCPICHKMFSILSLVDHLKAHVKDVDDDIEVPRKEEKIEKTIESSSNVNEVDDGDEEDMDDDYDEDDDDNYDEDNNDDGDGDNGKINEKDQSVKIEIDISDDDDVIGNDNENVAINSELNNIE